jgi:hypothetical protein
MPKKTTKTEEKTTEKARKPDKDASGKFAKGRDKTGGRKAGTKNKYGNIRDRLKSIIMPYLETDPEQMKNPKVPSFAKDIMAIDDPKDRAEVVSKYLPFIVPKYSSTTITADANRPVDEEQELLELDQAYTKKELTLTLKEVTIVNNDVATTPPPPITDFDPDEDDDFDIESLQ